MSIDVKNIAEDALDDLKGRYLTFFIDDTCYGIELLYISEIISVLPVTHIPGLPVYFKGVINRRGKVAPVIDVRLKFGQEERPYDDKTCIIIVNISDMQVGLIVDMVADVVSMENALRNPPPETGRNGDRYLASIANVGGKVILNIDCEKFFQSDLRLY